MLKKIKDLTKEQLTEKETKMYIKIILSTLKQTMRDCKTYEEFKKYINSIFKEVSEDEEK